jgi:hypothetical protein
MSIPVPFVFDQSQLVKRFAPATIRNQDAIVAVLRHILPATGLVLEVASGTGEHAVHFAKIFPQLKFQPSDFDPVALASIDAWADEANLPNLLPAVMLDAANHWSLPDVSAVLCINMVHISPWCATAGLFKSSAEILAIGAPLYLYGPYMRSGVVTADSNLAFDASLKERNPDWGLRSVDDVNSVAATHGFSLDQMIEMPAENLSLVYRRSGASFS